jgi:putative spermidine/putrescine transport system ATP-binding protein
MTTSWQTAHGAVPLQGASDGDHGAELQIENLSKRFGDVVAVEAVDLSVRRGEFLTLLGPSGSGKTTLLMMIAGFLEPTAGEMKMNGASIRPLLPEQRNFGMVFQGYALFPHMTVRGNIAYPLEVRRQPRATIDKRVADMLALVQLEGFSDRYPRQLSGGQQQRVALARALSFGPRLLLLDEPLGALDRKLRGDVQEELKDLHRRTGTTFIYVTHDQDEALSMSDRIAIMNHGRVIQVGTPGELYERPATVFTAGFLGKSNFLDASVSHVQGDTLTCDVGGNRFQQRAGAAAIAPGARITLALRPEKIGLAASADEATNVNKLKTVVRTVTYLGSMLELHLDAGPAGNMIVHAAAWRNESKYSAGRSAWIHWPEDAAVIVRKDTEVKPP